MQQMNWALFNPQATIRSPILLCLYCAVPSVDRTHFHLILSGTH